MKGLLARAQIRATLRRLFGLPPTAPKSTRPERDRRRRERLTADARAWERIEAEERRARAESMLTGEERLRAQLEIRRVLFPWDL